MSISVIIPIYNVEPYIERCARSILEQTYEDKEIIFVDDASPDRSIAVLNSVLANYPGQKVTVLHHAHNQGLAAARKTGLEAAKGEYVVSVDSDDYIEPNMLELVAKKAQETDADVIAMDGYFEWNNQRKIYRSKEESDPHAYSRLLVSGASLPSVWLHVIRRTLYTRTGIMPIEGLNYGEDYVVTPRLCWYANRIAKVPVSLYHYSQTNTSSIVRSVSTKNIENLIQAVSELTAFYSDKPDCTQALRAGQWLKKTELMMRLDKKDYPLAEQMPASLPVCTDTLNIAQRLAAPLVAHHCYTLLWLYSRSYTVLMEGLQCLKGRRRTC